MSVENPTYDELYAQAQALGVKGRSHMDKPELTEAIAAAQGEAPDEGTEASSDADENGPAAVDTVAVEAEDDVVVVTDSVAVEAEGVEPGTPIGAQRQPVPADFDPRVRETSTTVRPPVMPAEGDNPIAARNRGELDQPADGTYLNVVAPEDDVESVRTVEYLPSQFEYPAVPGPDGA